MTICNVETCNKKLSLVEETIKCKCLKIFCKQHRDFSKHSCQFDYKTSAKQELIKKNHIDIINSNKIIRF